MKSKRKPGRKPARNKWQAVVALGPQGKNASENLAQFVREVAKSASAYSNLVPGDPPDDGDQVPVGAAPTPPPSICEEAHAIVHGRGEGGYGHPRNNFARTAEIWTAILRADGTLEEGAVISAEQVGLCMIGVKLARQSFNPKRDNLVDIAGYAQTVDRVITGE